MFAILRRFDSFRVILSLIFPIDSTMKKTGPPKGSPVGKAKFCLFVVQNGFLSLFIEQMHLVHIQSNRDFVAALRSRSRLNTSGSSVAFDVQVQIGLSAHQLGNFYNSLYQSLRRLLDELRLIVNIFRTDTKGNFLANIRSQNIVLISGGGNLNGIRAKAPDNNRRLPLETVASIKFI